MHLLNPFPPSIAFAALTAAEAGTPLLFPSEHEQLAQVKAPGRREEWALGRACARQALASLGREALPLLSAPDRRPLWPEGIVGSLTHASGLALAAVGTRSTWAGLGLDLESYERPLSLKVARRICRLAEQNWLAKRPETSQICDLKLIFCAKEAIFKCFYPLSGVFFWFEDAEVWLDGEPGAFRANLCKTLHPGLPEGFEVFGQYRLTPEWMTAAVWLPADQFPFVEPAL